MDYSRIYNQLITRGQQRQVGLSRKSIIELIGKVERHHIIPRSIGGTDDKSNLVYLTLEEHFVAHELLVKIYPNDIGPLRALMILSGKGNRYRNNKLFGWARRRYSEMRKGSIPWNKGVPCNEETKSKIREARKSQIITDETRAKLSAAGTGSNNHFFGKTHSDKSKEQVSINNKSNKEVSINGTIYRSMAVAAKELGYKDYNTINRRCRSDKWPDWHFIDETYSKPIESTKPGFLISIDGVIYQSLSAATRAFGFGGSTTVKKRCLSEKWPTWFFLTVKVG